MEVERAIAPGPVETVVPEWNRMRSFTRFVMWFDCVGLLLLAGLGLNVFTDNTAKYFAWTIAVPLSAACLGVGYWTALPSALWGTRMREWDRARVFPVAAVVLTVFIMFASFRDLGLFHLHQGTAFSRVEAWIWLIGYLALPPLNGAAWLVQDRAAGGHRPPVGSPVLRFTKGMLVVHAVAYSLLGALLLFSFGAMNHIWPWPLTRLAAGAIGSWLLALAGAMWWSLAHPDWRQLRVLAPFFPLYFAGQLVSLVRFRGDLVGGSRTAIYAVVVSASLVAFAAMALRQEKSARATRPGSALQPAAGA
jgi:hypothetical protein